MKKKNLERNLKFSFYYISVLAVFANCQLQTANCFSQSRLTTFGIQFKPIFPVGFLGTGKQNVFQDSVKYATTLKGGYNFGMVIRKGFSEVLALEAGINYVRRKYHLDISELNHNESSEFRSVGYEIPVALLVYIRLGEQVFMNASLGASADMYASNVQSAGENHSTLTVRNHTFQPAVIANLGWEYRTERAGFVYLGSTLHRPFNYELTTQINYDPRNRDILVYQPLSGSYLTLDVRYFFFEDPKKKKKRNSGE